MYNISSTKNANQKITVPLVVIFTKFDAQIIQEFVMLNDLEDKWTKARKNAEITCNSIYFARVLGTQYPPKACVRLEGEENKHFNLRWRQYS